MLRTALELVDERPIREEPAPAEAAVAAPPTPAAPAAPQPVEADGDTGIRQIAG
jgi:hypothetical protein